MAKKLTAWKTKGMNRDLSVSAFNPEFAFENINLRLSTNDGNTLLSWVNEKGTLQIKIKASGDNGYLSGIPVGTAVLNHQLIVFTTSWKKEEKNLDSNYVSDYIYKLFFSNDEKTELETEILFNGNLNLSTKNPLETLVSYEAKNVQKVYWTDKRNQPRVINIVGDKTKWAGINTAFDFVPELALKEKITVKKICGSGGMFAPGVIQYAFTYFNKYGQESNIFYTTPLLYISHADRGGSPEDKIANSFEINISNIDKRFDYIRIYSIQRTSINATPICKRIQDLCLEGVYDTNTNTTSTSRAGSTGNVNAENIEKDYVCSATSPRATKDGITIGPDDVKPSRQFLRNPDTSWLGYKNEAGHTIKIGTDECSVTFGSAATVNSWLWVSTQRITYNGVKGYYIVETPSDADDGITEKILYSSTPVEPPIPDAPKKATLTYTDNGMSGDSIDPMELLYKGGESIIAGTMEKKDDTLFFGNIQIERSSLSDIRNSIKNAFLASSSNIRSWNRHIYFNSYTMADGNYPYANQLTVFKDDTNLESVPCGGFKTNNYYRLGVQFQYKTGKWSEPIYIKDFQMGEDASDAAHAHFAISYAGRRVQVPTIKGVLDKQMSTEIYNRGYRRMRALVVFPELQDSPTICQGIACPTLFTRNQRSNGITAQSSWFFRAPVSHKTDYIDWDKGTVIPTGGEKNTSGINWINIPLAYQSAKKEDSPNDLRRVEVQGDFKDDNRFCVDYSFLTLHTPDAEFDDTLMSVDFSETYPCKVGTCTISKTLSDIDIQTETPAISKVGGGFDKRSFKHSGMHGIVSGLFYDDYVIDERETDFGYSFEAYKYENDSVKWMVYPWQATGSLNNDISRPADAGTASAILKKKVISNLRLSNSTEYTVKTSGSTISCEVGCKPQLFHSEETTILKMGERMYMGNVDTSLMPDTADGNYFSYNLSYLKYKQPFSNKAAPHVDVDTSFISNSEKWHKLFSDNESSSDENGSWIWDKTENRWKRQDGDIGDDYVDLVVKKSQVRMKYKSTPHFAFKIGGNSNYIEVDAEELPVVEIRQDINKDNLFGGQSEDALRENNWIPCGEPVELGKSFNGDETSGNTIFEWSYGDTYYQRWDCLKTYPFTREDLNQIVEIGSFMLETRINIDGRYDRNRGQLSNINMSPQNFNLFNPVYSQIDNFFSYKLMDEDSYKNQIYPNQITWSKTNKSGADVDLWTNVTLASMLEMDGDKGEVTAIKRFNNQLICFQDTGISRILYNDNVQIQSTQGVPIEIANSGKVQGKDCISNTIGCSNKWSIVNTPSGIYFMDSNDKSIYMLGGNGLQSVSQTGGFNSWAKNNIPASNVNWTSDDFENFVTYYDKLNQDVLFINNNTALAYSEKLGAFTSFYDYGRSQYFCNLDDVGLWIRYGGAESGIDNMLDFLSLDVDYNFKAGDGIRLGNYVYRCINDTSAPPFPFIFDNDRSLVYEYFNNEFTAVVDNNQLNKDWIVQGNSTRIWKHQAGEYCNFFGTQKPYSMTLVGNPEPQLDKIFTNLEFRACVEGDGEFNQSTGKFIPTLPFNSLETWDEYQHGITTLENKNGHSAMQHGGDSSSLKRKFRIWRCDIPRDNTPNTADQVAGANYTLDTELGISRYNKRPNDRMRNPWLYLKLLKKKDTNHKTEIHDLIMTYFE